MFDIYIQILMLVSYVYVIVGFVVTVVAISDELQGNAEPLTAFQWLKSLSFIFFLGPGYFMYLVIAHMFKNEGT